VTIGSLGRVGTVVLGAIEVEEMVGSWEVIGSFDTQPGKSPNIMDAANNKHMRL
jgi:hypothetical protein